MFFDLVSPIDPNPAIAAHVVLPQPGHSRTEKRPFFHIFPHFPKKYPPKSINRIYRFPIYQIKADEVLFKVQQELIRFDKKLVRGNNFTLKISSNVWGNSGGILGNPGEIPHAGCRVRGSKGKKMHVINRDPPIISLY